MKKLFIIAPNDRFNYGDLLFPHIITAYFKAHFDEIVYCSTTKSDLSDKGGFPTESFHILYNITPEDDNYLMVAGGECLCVEWGIILSFISERYEKLFLRIDKFTRKWTKERRWRFRNFVAGKILHAKSYFPFTIGKNELPLFKGIFYNSLGGIGLARETYILQRRKVRDILKSVDYISVRDKVTGEILHSADIPNTLAADSAILLSDIFAEETLLGQINPALRTRLEKPYIFFQCNETIAMRDMPEIVDEIVKIGQHFDCEICLCPIGTATGHSDDKGLSEIYRRLQNTTVFSACHLVENPTIYDIMWLIKHARLYVGASLHGIITAMSFGVPYCGYCVEKVAHYIETWGDARCFAASTGQLSEACVHACSQPAAPAEAQKESVRKSFGKMRQYILVDEK